MAEVYDTIIIGGGVTGFGAAMYAGRFNMKTLVVSEIRGGTIILTDTVENYPGFIKLTGMELAQKIEEHAKQYNIEVHDGKVIDVSKKGNCFAVATKSKTFETKTIIFATGTHWRKLNVPGEQEFSNKGVHYCALCDGPLYQGKTLGVVGGSDSAAKEALLLSNYAKKVYMFLRGEKLRPEPVNLKRVEENKKIEVFTKVQVKEIKGKERLEKVILDREINGSKEFPLDGLFVEIGHIPLSELAVKLGIKTNGKGEIIIDRNAKTNVPGIYAAGDVVDTVFKQAITGVAEGVVASYSAYQYVTNEFVC